MLGLFGIGWFPIYILQIAETAPKSSIASTVSLATTLCMIAMALGPFIFGLLVDLAGYRLAWGVLIAPVLLTAVPLCRSLPRR
jgi:predicted MFS family arabinose efflux permease